MGPVRRRPPGGNTDIAAASDEYRTVLADGATFTSTTIEDVLAAEVLAPTTSAARRDRHLPERRQARGPPTRFALS